MAKKERTTGERLRALNKKQRKRDRWIRSRMWFSTFVSALYNDRGVIPQNIGNKMLILNNMYITKNSLSMVILIKEFSLDTPVGFISDMLQFVKKQVKGVVVDYTMKNIKYNVNVNDDGLKNRVKTWEKTVSNPLSPSSYAVRAARLLYTVDVAKSREKIYKTRFYITVRAATGNVLNMGLEQVCTYLDQYNISYKVLKSNLNQHLEYYSVLSDKMSKKIKDVPYMLMSNQTIAESLPVIQGLNDPNGTLMGLDVDSYGPYFINFRLTANAKNIYIGAQSGFGKTFLALTWVIDFFAQGYCLCIQDIKGTEFTAFTKAVGGIVFSLRPESTLYINYFVWDIDEIPKGDSPSTYVYRQFNRAKEMLLLMAVCEGIDASKCEALFEEFLNSVYLTIGASMDNPNTWFRTKDLNPYVIYESFLKYLSAAVRQKYEFCEQVASRLQIYLDRSGSKAYMFKDAVSYIDILDSPVLTFDFGLLEGQGDTDPVMFKLKVQTMRILNDEFVAYKKRQGLWTVKILEESQVVPEYIIDLYVKEITLGRARNQINVMLGNSVSTLTDNPRFKAAIENINIVVLGVLTSSIKTTVDAFTLKEEDEERLRMINSQDPEYDNTFLLVNKMQRDSITSMVRAYVPKRVVNGKLFKVVDTIEDE